MRVLIFLSFIFISGSFFSQIRVYGQIVDENDNSLELAEVLLMTNDSVAIASTLTNESGSFSMNNKDAGQYILRVKYFKNTLLNLNVALNSNTDLGKIKVKGNNFLIEKVVLEGKKKLIERKVDRLVFNVENSVSAAGGDALDALMVTPGIRVQNDKISIIGKSGLSVMVNDRLMQLSGDDLINYLRSVPVSDIKNIEVITTPPAKYSAEGNSGIINISLKKAKNNSWNSTFNTSYRQGFYGMGSIGGLFNYQKNKVALSTSINYLNGAYFSEENASVFYPENTWYNHNRYKNYSDNLNLRVSLDYEITKRWTTGFQYIGNLSNPNVSERLNTDILGFSGQKANLYTTGLNRRDNDLTSLNWHSKIDLDTLGRKLNIDFDFFNYKAGNNRDYYTKTTGSFINGINDGDVFVNNTSLQKINNYSIQFDIEHPLKWMKLNYGSRLSFSTTNNNITLNRISENKIELDAFRYKEDVQAVYVSGNKSFADGIWDVQLGIRAENTQTDGTSRSLNETTKNNYLKFFPTAYVKYKPNKKHTYSLNYSRRIYRPAFGQLNPFKWYSNDFAYSTGNPSLMPVFVDNLEFNYSYKDHLQTTLYYSYDSNNSSRVVYFNENNYNQISIPLNYFDDYSIGVKQLYIFQKLKWWESTNQMDVYYFHSNSTIYPITPRSSEGVGAVVSTYNNFSLNEGKTIQLGLNFQYFFPRISGDLVENKGMALMGLSSKFLFLKNKLLLAVSVNNLFKTFDYNAKSYRSNIYNQYNGYFDSQYVRLSLRYQFGSDKPKDQMRNVGNKDERQRIN